MKRLKCCSNWNFVSFFRSFNIFEAQRLIFYLPFNKHPPRQVGKHTLSLSTYDTHTHTNTHTVYHFFLTHRQGIFMQLEQVHLLLYFVCYVLNLSLKAHTNTRAHFHAHTFPHIHTLPHSKRIRHLIDE